MEVIQAINSIKKSSAHITQDKIERRSIVSRSSLVQKRTSIRHKNSIFQEMKIINFLKINDFEKKKEVMNSNQQKVMFPSNFKLKATNLNENVSQNQQKISDKKRYKKKFNKFNSFIHKQNENEHLMNFLRQKIEICHHYISHKKNRINDKLVSIYSPKKQNFDPRSSKQPHQWLGRASNFNDQKIELTKEKRKERHTEWFSRCKNIGEENALKMQRLIQGGYHQSCDDFTEIFDLSAFKRTNEQFKSMKNVYSSICVQAKAKDLLSAKEQTLFNVVGYIQQCHRMHPEQRLRVQTHMKIAETEGIRRY